MSTRHQLLRLLADGAFHSGTDLGAAVGVSRAAVNKAVQGLVGEGLDIHSVPGRGYRLAESFVPLSARTIESLLATVRRPLPVEVLEHTDSTNQQVLRTGAEPGSGRACLAEAQYAGRGRRGRSWVATPYHNVILSILWRFELGPAALVGLSLAAGVAVLRALRAFGIREAALKWPNDVLLDRRKLAGLLIDLRGEANGPSTVVLGLGLNVHVAPREAALIDQPWVALREVMPGPVDRNRLAALLIAEFSDMFETFERDGFEPYRRAWERDHAYQQREVQLQLGQDRVTGTVVGIDAEGSLQLRDASGQVRAYRSGEVSLRAVS
jgi:BirA family biotin operon repressor/biotin-[acetyl-CoA-carboxylase] ligase